MVNPISVSLTQNRPGEYSIAYQIKNTDGEERYLSIETFEYEYEDSEGDDYDATEDVILISDTLTDAENDAAEPAKRNHRPCAGATSRPMAIIRALPSPIPRKKAWYLHQKSLKRSTLRKVAVRITGAREIPENDRHPQRRGRPSRVGGSVRRWG